MAPALACPLKPAVVSGTLSVSTEPAIDAFTGVAILRQPAVQLSTATSGVTVTASLVSGSPTLANATAVTDAAGLATFAGLALTGTYGLYRLRFTAPGYTGVNAAADTELHQSAPIVDWWPGVTVTYADSAALQNDNTWFVRSEDKPSAGSVQLVLETAFGFGHSTQCLRCDYPANSAEEYELGRNLRFASNYQAIWGEVWVRFSSNFTTDGQSGSSKNRDLKLIFGRMLNASGWRTTLKVGNGTAPGQWKGGFQNDGQTGTTAGGGSLGQSEDTYSVSAASRPMSDVWDGADYRIRFYFKRSTDRSTADGAFGWWLDNAASAPVFYDDAVIYTGPTVGVTDPENFYGLAMGRNMNRGTPAGVAMSLAWLRARIHTTDPGWPTS